MANFRSLVPGGFYSDGTSGPVSVRSNNPGAINGAAWERTYPGFVGNIKYDGKNDTTVFETPEHGVACWWELLRRYRDRYDAKTVEDIITTYGGGQDYSSYVTSVCKRTGFSPSTRINLDNDEQLLTFARAMFHVEAGVESPLKNAQILYGFRMGRNGGKEPKGGYKPPGSVPSVSQRPTRGLLRGAFKLLMALWRGRRK